MLSCSCNNNSHRCWGVRTKDVWGWLPLLVYQASRISTLNFGPNGVFPVQTVSLPKGWWWSSSWSWCILSGFPDILCPSLHYTNNGCWWDQSVMRSYQWTSIRSVSDQAVRFETFWSNGCSNHYLFRLSFKQEMIRTKPRVVRSHALVGQQLHHILWHSFGHPNLAQVDQHIQLNSGKTGANTER